MFEILVSVGVGGIGGISPLYFTIVPWTFGIPKGSTGFKKFPHVHAWVVESSRCKCVPVEFPVFPHFSEFLSKD